MKKIPVALHCLGTASLAGILAILAACMPEHDVQQASHPVVPEGVQAQPPHTVRPVPEPPDAEPQSAPQDSRQGSATQH